MIGIRAGELRRVRVIATRQVAQDVRAFELVSADGRLLTPFTPGAHVDVQVPMGQVRQYSLCGDARDRARYMIAVKRETAGRGGSASMHADVEEGSILAIAGPRNNFPLAGAARRSVLIAGGIGVTPIAAMVRALAAGGQDWELHYCTRSRRHAAFHDELRALDNHRVLTYFSEAPVLDAAALLRSQPEGTHVYCCGPAGLMRSVSAVTAHWAPGLVHFEWFAPPEQEAGMAAPFEVELARSRKVLPVPQDRSVLGVLRANGVVVPSSCEQGVCGTCETAVLAGEVDHRDKLLSPAEREASRTMMICVSRARCERLVLDL